MTTTPTAEWQGRHGAKDRLRQEIWATLKTQRAVQRDPVGHIPNFLDAATAAAHLAAGTPAPLEVAQLTQKQQDVRRKTHETIAKVSDDYGRRQTFNTAIAAVMELLNEITKSADHSTAQGLAVEREALEAAILLLAPIVPHIAHHLWQAFDHREPVIDHPWPRHDESALSRATIELVVQVNGKLRARIEIAAEAERDAIEAAALANDNVKRFTDDKKIRKIIVVPGKLVNIVVGN